MDTAVAADQESIDEAFVWSAKYETGIELVDQQHHGLVDLINRVGAAYRQAAPPAMLEPVLDQLVVYARDHFAMEHQLMRDAGLDDGFVCQHVGAHGSFAKQVELMRGCLHKSPQTLLPGLLRYLITWLAEHILVEDQAMAWQVRAIRGGMSPEAARAWAASKANPSHDALVEAMHRMYAELAQRNSEMERMNARLLEREQQLEHARRELASFNAGLGQRVAQRTAEVYEAQLRLQQEYDAQRALTKQLERTRRELEAQTAGLPSLEFIDEMFRNLDAIEQQLAAASPGVVDPQRAFAALGKMRDAIATLRSVR